MVGDLATGKVIRYDEIKGYGFIAPDGGGDDVFVHVNDLEFNKYLFTPGTHVRFSIEDGGRGLKASAVQLHTPDGESAVNPVRTETVAQVAEPRPGGEDEDLCDVLSTKEFVEELTESLLVSVPTLTAEQVVQVRQRLVAIAHAHGWLELR